MISEEQMLLLRALSATGESAVAAFLEWRARVPLNDIDNSAFRIISLLVNLVRREGLNDADILRLKGIERHIWAANTLKLRQLFHALDILERAKVRPMLLKGAALMARMPAIAAKRIVGDYDILIEDAAVERAKTHLINAGYWMVGFSFDDLDGELQRSPTAGVPIASIGGAGEIDLHWRSLPNIFDPDLTRTLFEAGEQHAIQGRAVLVPTLTHHLFLTLARCQPWDQHECFTRLIEGYFLLVDSISHVDWNELSTLVRKHGLEASAVVFLDILQKECRVKVPKWFLARLRWSAVGLKAQEWRIRSLPPAVRSPVQNWFLERQDRTYYRSQSEFFHRRSSNRSCHSTEKVASDWFGYGISRVVVIVGLQRNVRVTYRASLIRKVAVAGAKAFGRLWPFRCPNNSAAAKTSLFWRNALMERDFRSEFLLQAESRQ